MDKQKEGYLIVYINYLPKLREAAKELGYAIAVHGSMTRDFDLIAVPWTENASSQKELVEAFEKVVNYNLLHLMPTGKEKKPYGRTAYDIHIGHGMYIDLSIIDIKE